ncbi:MAG: DUF2157 domain-containing protein [Rhizobiaceae bacterium]|jgi:uncharacterized membrane protein
MFAQRSHLRREIVRWRDAGLVDGTTAERLLLDVETRQDEGMSFGSVLAIMAAILVAAAILVFIAANWEAIPRLARVGALFALIAAGYVGGAVLKGRDHPGFGEALFIIGAASFGAAIALIGQMYHMTGDETAAVLTWCLGTTLAAAVLRSPVLTAAAVLIAVAWLLMLADGMRVYRYAFLLLGIVIWAVSYWTHGRAARHLLLLSAILWAFVVGIDGRPVEAGLALALVSAAVFAAAHWAQETVERLARLGGPYPAHPLIGFLVGMAMIQVEVYEHFVPMLLATLIAFAGIIAALVLRGRESRLMRWIAYVAFAIELCFAYIVTVGSMIDTAGLFLFSGLALAVVAFIIVRIEKRMTGRPAMQGGAA